MSDIQEKKSKQGLEKLNLKASELVRNKTIKAQEKELTKLYSRLSQKVAERAERMNPDRNISSAIRQNYLHELQKELEIELKSISVETEEIIQKSMLNTSKAVTIDNSSFLKSVGMRGIDEAYSHVPTDVVASIMGGNVYEGNWTLSKALWSDVKSKTKDINSIIAEGIALNKPSYDIAKDLEKYVDPTAKKPWDWNKVYPGVSKQIDYNAQRLARTLTAHAYQQSLVITTKPNPFVTGLEWRSANSGRTCELCMSRDGTVYDKDKLPLDHPNGMCTFLPVIPDSMEDIADRIANWYNGEPDEELDTFAEVLGYKGESQIMSAQDKSLESIANRTRNLKNEQLRVIDLNGNQVFETKGNRDSVTFTIGQARQYFDGNAVIHNHPDGGTFSSADIQSLRHGAKKIIVSSPEGNYVLKNLGDRGSAFDLQEALQKVEDQWQKPNNTIELRKEITRSLNKKYDIEGLGKKYFELKDEGNLDEAQKVMDEFTKIQRTITKEAEKLVREDTTNRYDSWYKENSKKYNMKYEFIPKEVKKK